MAFFENKLLALLYIMLRFGIFGINMAGLSCQLKVETILNPKIPLSTEDLALFCFYLVAFLLSILEFIIVFKAHYRMVAICFGVEMFVTLFALFLVKPMLERSSDLKDNMVIFPWWQVFIVQIGLYLALFDLSNELGEAARGPNQMKFKV